MTFSPRLRLLLALGLLSWAGAASPRAEEGFWLFSEAPIDKIADKYGIRLTSDWLDHLEQSTVRFNTKRFDVYIGGSGAFVSADGLIVTNRHVIPRQLLAAISRPDADLARDGFVAMSEREELELPGLSLDAIVASADVTAQVAAHVTAAGLGAENESSRREAIGEIERNASRAPGLVAEVVTLYSGARDILYVYRRYSDIRLVFAPEAEAARRLGDHPAPVFDVALVRAYESGVPARSPRFLRPSMRPLAEGEPIFISGVPTKSSRRLFVAELEAQRDIELPRWVRAYAEFHHRLAAFAAGSAEKARAAALLLGTIGFSRQIIEDRLASLQDGHFLAFRRQKESAILTALGERRDEQSIELIRSVGANVAGHVENKFRGELLAFGGPPPWRGQVVTLPYGVELAGPLYSFGNVLLKLRRERELPEKDRSDGYRVDERAELEKWLLGAQIIDPDIEALRLMSFFESLVETFGANHPVVQITLADASPAQRAENLVRGTRLADPAFRRALYESDREHFDAARDPLLDMLRSVERENSRIADAWRESERLLDEEGARARRVAASVREENSYPDGTRSARFGFGEVQSWVRQGSKIAAVTPLAAYYDSDGSDPTDFRRAPPPRWALAADKIDRKVPLDFVSTADVVGGNSGSPTVDAEGRLIGVVFGPGAIEGAIAADIAYQAGKPRRTAHVTAAAIIEALAHVYDASRLVDEMQRGDH
ncbi:S46 family peptidase [Methylosinus sp. KRF6]|uniref:S46 family peptidase n=1 Tax=Methylosinus sp. KRF6 TaxID=2846853 RepID=UPI001C0E291E|nr:S46 family peptidase [Methylosinus sp. KRF6]MBU3888036.1 S46 family peptidase [Methylosinus sp. KRF6]